MSDHSRNWLKFGALVAMAFLLGLFFAGILDLPRTSMAQDPGRGGRGTPIVPVDAPRIPAARPLADLSEAFSAVAEAVRPSVVFVESERPAQSTGARPQQPPPGMEPFFGEPQQPGRRGFEQSSGSGFVVSTDGYILTNHHVIEGATEVKVRLLDGRVFPASVVGSDRLTDVGVLKVEADGLSPAALGSSARTRVGEWVLAIGNPFGSELTFSVTQGIVSAKGRGQLQLGNRSNSEIQDFIQTDAAINRGNSGGPLVNVRGEVIGINSAIASVTGFYSGYAFAVPIDLARAVMNQLIERGRVERTQLGVLVQNASPEDALYLSLDSIAGVKVDNFSEDSPARRAGLAQGDVIVAVDGQPVTYVAQLQQLVGFRAPGETVEVVVARAEGRRTFTVRLTGSGAGDESLAVRPEPREETASPATDNRLGIAVEPLTPSLAAQVQVPGTVQGLLVREMADRSPARDHLCPVDGCSLPPDVILAIEGKPVRNEADFRNALAAGGRNGIVTLTIVSQLNDGQSRVVRVRLLDRR
jgi:serine protease Do